MGSFKRRGSLGLEQGGDNKRFCPESADNQGYLDGINHNSWQGHNHSSFPLCNSPDDEQPISDTGYSQDLVTPYSSNEELFAEREHSASLGIPPRQADFHSDGLMLDSTYQESWNQPALVFKNGINQLNTDGPGTFDQTYPSLPNVPADHLSISSLLTSKPDFDTLQAPPEYGGLDSVISMAEQSLIQTDDPICKTQKEEAKVETESPRYDTCFGAIVMTVTSSFEWEENKRSARVNLKPFGNLIKLSFVESKKYAGMIEMPALGKLLEKHSVQLIATLFAPGASQRKGKKANPYSDANQTIHIVVYGNLDEKDSVGACLDEGDAFLQHPTTVPYYPHIAYVNPHYLVRPGGEMPKLDELAIIDEEGELEVSKPMMSSKEKSDIMDIFDSALSITDTCYTAKQSPRLMTALKEHQLVALSVMLERESSNLEDFRFPSLWKRIEDTTPRYRNIITGDTRDKPIPLNGGIIADEMGLGKTLSLLALVCLSLDGFDERELPDYHPRATLIVLRLSTINVWVHQIKTHIRSGQIRYLVYHGPNRQRVQQAFGRHYDIVFTTYETLQRDAEAGNRLQDENWFRVVLDEAHYVRNRFSNLFKAVSKTKAYYRWCLTGTPIQNSLDDYSALLAFLRVWKFQDKRSFDFWITCPMKNKNRIDCTRDLQSLVAATCLRRTHAMVKEIVDLPTKVEVIESIRMTDSDRDIYDFFKRRASKYADNLGPANGTLPKANEKKENTLSLINNLRLICTHGKDLLPASAVAMWQNYKKTEQAQEVATQTEERPASSSGLEDAADLDASSHNPASIMPSTKVLALLKNLEKEQRTPEEGVSKPRKSVIFSQWTKMLDLVAEAVLRCNYEFTRIDGRSSFACRSSALRTFNEEDNCTLMLASTGSAAEGIDLTAARFVHILDPHWNPMIEAQVIGRVHRIGQSLEVVVTRYLIENSIEDYIRFIQKDKVWVTNTSLAGDSSEELPLDLDSERCEKLKQLLEAA